MELIIKTDTWYECRRRAQELGDDSLNSCITRVINYAMPPIWLTGELKKKCDYLANLRCKVSLLAGSLHVDKPDRRELLDRIDKLWKSLDERWIKFHKEYWDAATGGNKRIVINEDRSMEYSFYFSIVTENGRRYMDGGIIFNKDHWEIHT